MERLVIFLLVIPLKAAALVIAYLPTRARHGLAVFLGTWRGWASRRDRGQVLANLAGVWGLAGHTAHAQQFARYLLRTQVVNACDSIAALLRPQAVRIEGFETLKAHMREMNAAAKAVGAEGSLLITAHLGAWEMVGACAAQASVEEGGRFTALAKPLHRTVLTAFVGWLRGQQLAQVLRNDNPRLLREMLASLKGTQSWLGFVMDQKPAKRLGPVVDFLGQPTPFVAGPAEMARRGGRGVLSVYCVWVGIGRYRLLTERLLPPGHGLTDVGELTQLMANSIEAQVRCYPEQWVWNYKRWRTFQPSGAEVSVLRSFVNRLKGA